MKVRLSDSASTTHDNYNYSRYHTTEEYLASEGLIEVEVPRDGLCILHSVYGGLQSTLQGSTLCENEIKSVVMKEFWDHRDEYMRYSDLRVEKAYSQIKDWAEKGSYASDTCDLILNIMSQVLCLKILVVEEVGSHVNRLELRPHRTESMDSVLQTVTVIKNGLHFNYARADVKTRTVWSDTAVNNSGSDEENTQSNLVKREPCKPEVFQSRYVVLDFFPSPFAIGNKVMFCDSVHCCSISSNNRDGGNV